MAFKMIKKLCGRIREILLNSVFFKKKFLIVIVICFFLFSQKYNLSKYIHTLTQVASQHKASGLILDTPGCQIPKFDPFDSTVRHLIELKKPYVCLGDPVFMITFPNSTIFLNDTILKSHYNVSSQNISCFYNGIYRCRESKDAKRENCKKYGKSKKLHFGVPLREEFIQVQCNISAKNFTQYIPFVPIKPEVEKRAMTIQDNSNKLNVILIGIDSVSKLNFLRHFTKTRDFLMTNMSAFDMKGYTKVGDNTFPNLVPLLTGHFVEHYWNESLKNTMYFDHLDFIWKDYSKKGYRTFYAEDSPYYGTFNYLKRGFENPPTDYYFRPIGLAIHDRLRKTGDFFCLNNQMEVTVIYDYLKDFVKTMENRPYFAFAMVSVLTHDKLNRAGYSDEPTYTLLKDLWDNGVMNKSMVILFSDHGIRFGPIRQTYIGKFEERMPFMYLSLPEWFLLENSPISRNLEENQNRLITLFDIHKTLHHLLDIKKTITYDERSTNGLSLFGKISKRRTCETANILPHWCPCQVYQYVSTDDKMAFKVATALVRSINRKLRAYKVCAHLELNEIIDIRRGQANDFVIRFVKHVNDVIDRHVVYGDKVKTAPDFWVTLTTLPGGAMFEGTVRYRVERNTFQVLGISRINMYGTQSACIDSQILKKYCFCK